MTELRWLKGNYKFGSYKLQTREAYTLHSGEWKDVPVVEDKPKDKSLEEKFREYSNEYDWPVGGETLNALAKIAKQHYEWKK